MKQQVIIEKHYKSRNVTKLTKDDLRNIVTECVRQHHMNEGFKNSSWGRWGKAMFSSKKQLQKAYADEYKALMQRVQRCGFSERQLLGQGVGHLDEEQTKQLKELQKEFRNLQSWIKEFSLDQEQMVDKDTRREDSEREYREIVQQAARDGFSERQLLGRDINDLNDYQRKQLKKYQERFQSLQAWMKKVGIDVDLIKDKDEKESTCRDEWYKLRDSLRDALECAGLKGVDDETIEGYLFDIDTKNIGMEQGYGKSKEKYKTEGLSDSEAEAQCQKDYTKRLYFYKIVKKYQAKANDLKNWIRQQGVDIDDLTDVRIKQEFNSGKKSK